MAQRGTWISVDAAYSGPTGVALWSGPRVIETFVVDGLGAHAEWARIVPGDVERLVIEAGYYGKKNPSVAMKLAEARGAIQRSIEIISGGRAAIATWAKAEWGRAVGLTTNASRKVQKQQALAMCAWLRTPPERRTATAKPSRWQGLWLPEIGPSEDECEAVLLGLADQRLMNP